MNEIIKIDKTMWDVIENPGEYEIEICATAYTLIKDINRKLYEVQKNVEARILSEMHTDDASKLHYVNIAGDAQTLTIKQGAMKLTVTNPEEMIKDAGFDPNQLGSYVFKLLPWSKLKETRKLGGAIKELIDKLYVRGKQSLTIGE